MGKPKRNGLHIKKEPVRIENIGIGYSTDEILLAFNCDDEGCTEDAYVIPAEKLKNIIQVLFECGVSYQEMMNVDIGFGDDNDE